MGRVSGDDWGWADCSLVVCVCVCVCLDGWIWFKKGPRYVDCCRRRLRGSWFSFYSYEFAIDILYTIPTELLSHMRRGN